MNNPRFNEVINEVIQSGAKEAEKIEPSINLKLQTAVQNCYSKCNENPDKFANCMVETQKKVNELTESFQFKNLFLGTFIQNCLNTTNDVTKCTEEGKKSMKNINATLLKEIERIWFYAFCIEYQMTFIFNFK